MELKLKVIQGKNAGQDVPIPGKKFLIGRAEDCQLRPGSDMISRHHCAIIVDQSYIAVRDFGSKNGTYVNDQRVIGEAELRAGDRLRVGPLEFELVTSQGELGGRKKPPVHDAKEAAARAAATAGAGQDQDVSRWLSDLEPASPGPSTPRHLQNPATTETTTMKLGDTGEFDLGSVSGMESPKSTIVSKASELAKAVPEKAVVPKPAAAPTAAPAPVVPQAVLGPAPTPAPRVAAAPAPSAYVPSNEEPSATASDDSEKKAATLGQKKGFGKLPTMPQSKDSRDAAADMLNRLRKRR